MNLPAQDSSIRFIFSRYLPDLLALDSLPVCEYDLPTEHIAQIAGEEAQPELAQAPAEDKASTTIQPDPAIVEALVQMGFTENGSKRAAVATQVPHCRPPLLRTCHPHHANLQSASLALMSAKHLLSWASSKGFPGCRMEGLRLPWNGFCLTWMTLI